MIEVKNLTKKYQNNTVVNNVDVVIPKGKFTSIIGPNGAGKSTLLSMISRLTDANHGTIDIDELNIKKTASNLLAKKLAILRQHNQTSLKLTVKDLVAFGRFPHSGGRLTVQDQTHIDKAISYLGLKEIQDRSIDNLSGGQRQRVYVAMVLCQDTEYLLLDEPLNNIDIHHAVSMMKLLRNIVDEFNKTVVIVLHDINFASCYSDNIIAMKKGEIAWQGNPADVICSKNLSQLYEIPMQVHKLNNQNICVYY